MQTKVISYYAVAIDANGKIAQQFIRRENGKEVFCMWTGVTYTSQRAAIADLTRLNA